MHLKLLSHEAFSAQNAPNVVWRLGFARTRWETYMLLQIAGLMGAGAYL